MLSPKEARNGVLQATGFGGGVFYRARQAGLGHCSRNRWRAMITAHTRDERERELNSEMMKPGRMSGRRWRRHLDR
jgi:hypothetical protein